MKRLLIGVFLLVMLQGCCVIKAAGTCCSAALGLATTTAGVVASLV